MDEGKDSASKRFAEDKSSKLPLQTSELQDEKTSLASKEKLPEHTEKLKSCRGKRIVYVTSKDVNPLKDINEKTVIDIYTSPPLLSEIECKKMFGYEISNKIEPSCNIGTVIEYNDKGNIIYFYKTECLESYYCEFTLTQDSFSSFVNVKDLPQRYDNNLTIKSRNIINLIETNWHTSRDTIFNLMCSYLFFIPKFRIVRINSIAYPIVSSNGNFFNYTFIDPETKKVISPEMVSVKNLEITDIYDISKENFFKRKIQLLEDNTKPEFLGKLRLSIEDAISSARTTVSFYK